MDASKTPTQVEFIPIVTLCLRSDNSRSLNYEMRKLTIAELAEIIDAANAEMYRQYRMMKGLNEHLLDRNETLSKNYDDLYTDYLSIPGWIRNIYKGRYNNG